ncbi:MAG: hypothetical protein JWO50_160 [Candidatus Kaiserbacteria bacterium]|nr:hypothetical protein [Candidatus Kaiserbacteria bacterium]
MAFQRKKEDFVCEHCKVPTQGTGYTNHCPTCLWSKHVDIEPGDRGATCGGMMKPIGIEGTVARYMITHTCESCGHTKRNSAQSNDSPIALVALAQTQADIHMRIKK